MWGEEIFPNLGMEIRNGMANRDSKGPTWNNFVHERAIICPINEDVEEINNICLDKIDGEAHCYLSADSCVHKDDEVAFPTEFINEQTPASCPAHILKLKEGAPIILMRNLDAINGHVNGAQ